MISKVSVEKYQFKKADDIEWRGERCLPVKHTERWENWNKKRRLCDGQTALPFSSLAKGGSLCPASMSAHLWMCHHLCCNCHPCCWVHGGVAAPLSCWKRLFSCNREDTQAMGWSRCFCLFNHSPRNTLPVAPCSCTAVQEIWTCCLRASRLRKVAARRWAE